MTRSGLLIVAITHSANRVGTWSKVRIQPTIALPMMTSMTTPVAMPDSMRLSLNRAQVRSR
jgi:hypothetical protein